MNKRKAAVNQKAPAGAPVPKTSAPARKRIMLVDDHPMMRAGLAQFINKQPDMETCCEFGTAAEAFEGLCEYNPDLVLTDITMPGKNGIELVKDLLMASPALPILVISMHDETVYAERVLRAGARGYITKQEATTKVLVAIRKILSGEVYLSEHMVGRLLNRCTHGPPFGGSPLECLADRELEVFHMIGRGMATRQIAEELHIGVKTVESYRARIKEKLNLDSGAELVRHAIQWVNGMG